MSLILNKHVTVLFDRVALVRMGRPGPQGRRERRYDIEYVISDFKGNVTRVQDNSEMAYSSTLWQENTTWDILKPSCTANNRYVVIYYYSIHFHKSPLFPFDET